MNTSDYQKASVRLNELSSIMQIEIMRIRIQKMANFRPRRILMTIPDDYIHQVLKYKRKIMEADAAAMDEIVYRTYNEPLDNKMNGLYPMMQPDPEHYASVIFKAHFEHLRSKKKNNDNDN
jgi:hypothetical protein